MEIAKKKFTRSVLTLSIYPWLVMSLCAAFLFYKYALQVSPSIMSNDLMREFKVDGFGFGNLAATFFYAYTIMQLFAGVLLDKYGPRLLTTLAIGACAIGAYAFAHSYSLLTAQLSRALMGVGAAFATIAYIKMTAVWFKPCQAAFVIGLMATAVTMGAIFGQVPLAWIVGHIGWRDSLGWCALLGFIIATLFCLVARNHNPSQLKKQSVSVAFSWYDVLQVLRNKQNWLLMFYGGLAFQPLAIFGGLWGPPYLQQAYDLSMTHAASLASLSFIGLAFGSPLLGLLSDRLGKRRLVMMCSACLALLFFLATVYLRLNLAWVAVLLFLFGFSSGAFMLVFALARDSNKLVLLATVVAIINTGDALLGALSEPLLGKFLDMHWNGASKNGVPSFSVANYQLAFSLLSAYLGLALITLGFIKEPAAATIELIS